VSTRALGNNFVNKIIEKVFKPARYAIEKAKAKIIWIPERRFDPVSKRQIIIQENGRAKLRPITQAEDLFGCIDLMAVHPKSPWTFLIQATIGDDRRRQMRQKKILEAQIFNPAVHKVQVWQRDGENKQIVHIFELTRDQDERWGWRKFDFDFKTQGLKDVIEGGDHFTLGRVLSR